MRLSFTPRAPTLRARSLPSVFAAVMPVTAAVQVLGFVATMLLARSFGATIATDAYLVALSIYLLVGGILLSAVQSGAVLALTESASTGRADFATQAGELLTAVATATVGITVVVTPLAVWAVPDLLDTQGAETAALARLLVLELAPLAILSAVTGVLGALLCATGLVWASAAALSVDPLLRTVLLAVVGDAWGIHALAVVHLVAGMTAVLLLLAVARRRGVRIRFSFAVRSPFVRSVLALSAPLLAGYAALALNPIVDRAMAASLGAGSVTELDLGFRVMSVPVALLGSALVAPVLAKWQALASLDGWSEVRESAGSLIRGVLLIGPPVAVLGILLADELVEVLFGGGAYSAAALKDTGAVVAALAPAVPAQLLVIICSTLFVLRRDTTTPMLIAFGNVVLNAGLNLVLREPLGVAGLALSSTITVTLLCGVYVILLHRRYHDLQVWRARWPAVVRFAVSLIAMAAVGGALLAALPPSTQTLSTIARGLLVTVAVVGVHVVTLGGAGRSWRTIRASRAP